MKILLICKWVAGAAKGDFYYPGSWRDTFELACAFADLNQEIHILTPKVFKKHQKRFSKEFGNVLDQKGIIHHFAPSNLTFGTSYSPYRLKMFFGEITLVNKIKPDIVQYMQFGPSAIYPFAKNIPIIFYSCDLFAPYPKESEDRRLILENWGDRFQKYNPLVILQNLVFAFLINLMGSGTPKDALTKGAFLLLMHPQGFKNFQKKYPSQNIYLIEKGIPKVSAISKHENRQSSPTILFVGSILYRKGIFDLIDALNLVRSDFPKVKLLIAGSGPAQAISLLKKSLRKARFAAKYLGPIPYPQRFKLFQKADIFCLPSYQDAYPSVILEAMTVGLPTVTTRQIDTPIINNNSGILVETGDIEGLARAVKKLITSPKLYAKISQNAARTAAGLTWQKQTKKFLNLYSAILAQRTP